MLSSQSVTRAIFGSWLLSISGRTVSGLEMKIESVKCESRAVRIEFGYICNGDYLCTFGEKESLEGDFIYYGLVDTWDMDADDVIYLYSDLTFNVGGYKQTQNLMNMVPMTLCNNYLTSSNNDGDCPADGNYYFNTTYKIPAIQNVFLDWSATGWTGEILLAMYQNKTSDGHVLGRCKMQIQTMVTGSYENGGLKTVPSAKMTMLVVFAVLGALLVGVAISCSCRQDNKEKDVDNGAFNLIQDSDARSRYTRMTEDRVIIL